MCHDDTEAIQTQILRSKGHPEKNTWTKSADNAAITSTEIKAKPLDSHPLIFLTYNLWLSRSCWKVYLVIFHCSDGD